MSERTRLDRIVEEEFHVNLGIQDIREMSIARAKRIAERAFRHGVDQALLAEWTHLQRRGVGLHTNPAKVQPAPAEEKPIPRPPFKSGLVADLLAGQCEIRCCLPKGHEERCELSDRRKGQRRKFLNWPENYVHGVGEESRPIFQQGPHGSFMYDRRSDNDRRSLDKNGSCL